MMFGGSYDPRTDEISGVKPYSWGWWHEKGHQRQFNNSNVVKIDGFLHDLVQQYTFYLAIGFILVDKGVFGVILVGLAGFMYGVWNLLLEVEAWIYAIKKKFS